MHGLNLAELSAGVLPEKQPEKIIVAPIAENVDTPAAEPTAPTYAIDPRNVYNRTYEIINTTFLNTSGGALDLVLGTMIGDPANVAAGGIPGLALANGAAGVADKAGATTPFWVVLNKRIIAQEIIISRFTVFTATDALGLAQRSNSINGLEIDYNTSNCQDTGRIPISDTRVNSVSTVVPIALGPGTGIRYTLNDVTAISIEIEITGRAVPNFGK